MRRRSIKMEKVYEAAINLRVIVRASNEDDAVEKAIEVIQGRNILDIDMDTSASEMSEEDAQTLYIEE
jgi:hypothetical protein